MKNYPLCAVYNIIENYRKEIALWITKLNLSVKKKRKKRSVSMNSEKADKKYSSNNDLSDLYKSSLKRESISKQGRNKCVIPYLPPYLKNITLTEEGNETFRNDENDNNNNKKKEINWEKMEMLCQIKNEIVSFQKFAKYSLQSLPLFNRYISEDALVFGYDVLRKLSHKIKPRARIIKKGNRTKKNDARGSWPKDFRQKKNK